MSAIDFILTGLGASCLGGICGLWFKLGSAIESNAATHGRMDALTHRVRDIEKLVWSKKEGY